jgi:chloride channel protein, CIC family
MKPRFAAILMRLRKRGPLLGAFAGVIVGLVVGLAVVGWREGIDAIQLVALGTDAEILTPDLARQPWWRIVAALLAGGLIVGVVNHVAMPGRRPSGIADVIKAAQADDGRMSVKGGIIGAALTALSIGCGASVGREGPAVHIGASLSAWVAALLGMPARHARTLLGCGAAAAVAASFNAPIAGALFAHEVVVGHYGLRALAPVVMASASATVVSRWWYGDFPAFSVPPSAMHNFAELPAFAVLGVGCGGLAVLFMAGLIRTSREVGRLPLPAWLRPVIGAVIVAAIALVEPRVLGVGYEAMDLALRGGLAWHAILLLLGAKFVATIASLGFGFHGGVFSPSLILGAVFGGALGSAMAALFPDLASGPAAYALVGAAAMSSAVLGAPISTALIVFELTADYRLAVAVMVAVVVSNQVARGFARMPSYFHWQLAARGIDLDRESDHAFLSDLSVGDAMRPLPPGAPEPAPPGALALDDRLEAALERLGVTDRADLPVAGPGPRGEAVVVGVIGRADALAAYNRALLEALHER